MKPFVYEEHYDALSGETYITVILKDRSRSSKEVEIDFRISDCPSELEREIIQDIARRLTCIE